MVPRKRAPSRIGIDKSRPGQVEIGQIGVGQITAIAIDRFSGIECFLDPGEMVLEKGIGGDRAGNR